MRILLVEDDSGFGESVRGAMEIYGHSVTRACNAEEAYVYASCTEFEMAFVDYDLGFAQDTGDRVCEKLKEWQPTMFVVGWSGLDRDWRGIPDAVLNKMEVEEAMNLIVVEAKTREDS